MIRTRRAALAQSGYRFSEKHALGLDPRDHAQTRLRGIFNGTHARGNRFLLMRMKISLLLSCVLMAASGLAAAQAPPAPTTPPPQTAPPPPQRPVECAPMQAPNSGTATPDGQTTGRSEPLGDKLARSNGVLCPPAGVDPEMRAPTPDGGNTPVIPPPGSPGGDPNVRPK